MGSSKVPGSIQVAWTKKGTVTKNAPSLPGMTLGALFVVLSSPTSLTTVQTILQTKKLSG